MAWFTTCNCVPDGNYQQRIRPSFSAGTYSRKVRISEFKRLRIFFKNSHWKATKK
jgi:hypothetical protein